MPAVRGSRVAPEGALELLERDAPLQPRDTVAVVDEEQSRDLADAEAAYGLGLGVGVDPADRDAVSPSCLQTGDDGLHAPRGARGPARDEHEARTPTRGSAHPQSLPHHGSFQTRRQRPRAI